MRKVFTVKGTADSYGGPERFLFVEEAETEKPVMMNAYGGMMDYLFEVGGTDEEEKYMDKIFVYDRMCTLQAIVIPSGTGKLPVKAIIFNSKSHTAEVYGEKKIISTRNPEPMSYEDWKEAWEFAAEEGYNLNAVSY